jgi:hypothetical protein
MSWVITGSEKTPVDLYRSQVSLLLHGDGANGSTTITDSSPSPKTVTAVGNAQISTAQSKFGGASIAFDGTGDYLEVAFASIVNSFEADFTIEWWQLLSNPATAQSVVNLLVSGNGAIKVGAGFMQVYYQSNNIARTVSFGSGWQHCAVCRNAGAFLLFVDGVTGANNIANNSGAGLPTRFDIGRNNGDYASLNGYIDDLRITKGVARYTANFTPPTAPFPDF